MNTSSLPSHRLLMRHRQYKIEDVWDGEPVSSDDENYTLPIYNFLGFRFVPNTQKTCQKKITRKRPQRQHEIQKKPQQSDATNLGNGDCTVSLEKLEGEDINLTNENSNSPVKNLGREGMLRKRRGSNGWEDSLRPIPAQTHAYQHVIIQRYNKPKKQILDGTKKNKAKHLEKSSKKIKLQENFVKEISSSDIPNETGSGELGNNGETGTVYDEIGNDSESDTLSNTSSEEEYSSRKRSSNIRKIRVQTQKTANITLPKLEKRNNSKCDEADTGVGEIVWAKLGNQRWWPAMVIWGSDCAHRPARLEHTWVFWYGDYKVSEVPRDKLANFIDGFDRKAMDFTGKMFKQAVLEAIYDCAVRGGKEISENDAQELHDWAKGGFKTSQLTPEAFKPNPSQHLTEFVIKHLTKVKDQFDYSFTYSYDDSSAIPRSYNSEEREAIKNVRAGISKLEDICIACARPGIKLVANHPLFEGGICMTCKIDLMETMFAYGEDGTNAYCVICANSGTLLICDNNDCNRVYCLSCFDLLAGPESYKEALQEDPWLCYLCTHHTPRNTNLLKKRLDWQQNVVRLFQPANPLQEVSPKDFKERRPIRVLSLFDGIGTGETLKGKFVLDQLGLDIDVYYSTEIDTDAINVCRVQHKDSIIQLGKMEDISDAKVAQICPIDLVIGGSPCNDISLVNPARKGLYDPTGTGKLFFDFFRVLKAVQLANQPRHVFWLFENVASMPQDFKATISRFLQCEPALWDSKFFSPQNRARYFWGNIPGMYCPMNPSLIHNPYTLDSVLTPHCNRKAVVEKIRTVTTRSNSLKQGKQMILPVIMDGKGDVLWITELERVFGFPDHYTDAGNIALGRRQQLLGKAWSVPVIKHLFTPLRNFFKTTNSTFSAVSSSTASN